MNTKQPNEMVSLLLVIFRWKKLILSFFILACISAIILSGPRFISPLYKSEVILYPPATTSTYSPFEKNPGFGSEKEINEQIQILKSGLLMDTIIRKYKLTNHYHIDTSRIQWRDDLYKKIESNINIERTRYNSISVVVLDRDPLLAAQLANDIVKIGDVVKNKILIDGLRNGARNRNNDSLLASYYFPPCYVVTPASASYKKVFPVRWIIVVVSGFGSLIFFSLLAVLIEKLRGLNKDLKLQTNG
jgi:uncharacterized protein involved in exopolysaccharide biosynthesis